MNANEILNTVVFNLNLGKLIEDPSRVSDGLIYKMYKVVTDKNK